MSTYSLFDLDNTLLNGDSDHAWGVFLADNEVVNSKTFREKNEAYYQDYVNGTLDIYAYHAFSLEPLVQNSRTKMEAMRAQFLQDIIRPMITTAAKELVQEHKDKGHHCIIITATNSFVTRPIADIFQVEHLIATEPEVVDGQFTGRLNGLPCFQEGKITRFEQWLESRGLCRDTIDHIYAYSDSMNDLPLLQMADSPHAVNPDQRLEKHAKEHHWPIRWFNTP